MASRMDGRVVRDSNVRRTLGRGELVRALYRLGKTSASGVLTITPRTQHASRSEVFVLRRGSVVLASADELAKRALVARLVRLVAIESVTFVWEGGVSAAPPGAPHHLPLAAWSRSHLEQQLDGALAERTLRELAGARLCIRPELAPEPTDESDRRMLAAMSTPRRLDQIWPLARTPRFRLLAFVHFLRAVDALEAEGIVAERSAPIARPMPEPADAFILAARRVLGVSAEDTAETVKRAYRRLARALHPDLQPEALPHERRRLEHRFAEITAAYEALL